jgi:hypothetical protein
LTCVCGGSGATATITVTGGIVNTLGALTPGSGYTDGTYTGVTTTTNGAGTGATLNITVVGGVVTAAVLGSSKGSGYAVGDTLSTAVIGAGSGFSIPVATITTKLATVTLIDSGSGYAVGDSLTTANTNIGGTGSGFSILVAKLGGPVTGVTLANPGFGYTAGDSLTTANTNIGGTGSGFAVAVLTVNTTTTADGFVLKISLPKQPTPWTQLSSCPAVSTTCAYGKVVAAYDINPTAGLGFGCGVAGTGAGPAGLSIGPSFNGTNSNGLIALGCGSGSVYSALIIDDNYTVSYPFSLPKGTDETWYDPATNHFFFAQSGTGPASGWLGVVDANEYPPRSYLQEDGDNTTGPPDQDPTAVAATGSHSVAVLPGTCGSSTRLSRVHVPTRSTLTVPNNGSTFCSSYLGGFPSTGAAPQWPTGTSQAPTATTYDEWGCITVFTAPATCTSTGHSNPSP